MMTDIAFNTAVSAMSHRARLVRESAPLVDILQALLVEADAWEEAGMSDVAERCRNEAKVSRFIKKQRVRR